MVFMKTAESSWYLEEYTAKALNPLFLKYVQDIKVIQNFVYQQLFYDSYAFNFVLNCDLLASYFEDYSVCPERIYWCI